MSEVISKRLAIFAGGGDLPRLASTRALSEGFEVYVIAITPEAKADLAGKYTHCEVISWAKLETVREFLQRFALTETVILGKVDKLWALAQIPHLDPLARYYLTKMIDFNDNTLHRVMEEAARDLALTLLPQWRFLQDLLAEEKLYYQAPGFEQLSEDIEYAFDMAYRASSLEVSQTVIVKAKAVMAFEAAEGTDKSIQRGCQLASTGAVIAKVPWTRQLETLDIPAVGPRTIECIARGKGAALVVAAGKTFVIDLARTIELAKKHQISFLGLRALAKELN